MEDKFPKYTKAFWKYWWVWTPILLIIIIAASSGGNGDKNTNTPTPEVKKTEEAASQTSIPKEVAQKELTELMDLSIKAGVVKSYEFSDKASVVYVESIWYTQTVALKKDFLAKVAMLKKSITGYGHFEARDAYSNEKVGEVTAFSQSLEVYK